MGAYPLKDAEIPALLAETGFREVAVDFFTVLYYCPDSADVSRGTALESIEVNRLECLEALRKPLRMAPAALAPEEAARAELLINARFDRRREDYLRGRRRWDMVAGTVMAVTGIK